MRKETHDYLLSQWGEIRAEHSLLDRHAPDILDRVMGFRRALLPSSAKNSAIPAMYRELIVVAIEVATGRGGKGIDHAKKAIEAGASLRQLAETLGLCIYLSGMTTWVDAGSACLSAAEENKRTQPRIRKRVQSSNL